MFGGPESVCLRDARKLEAPGGTLDSILIKFEDTEDSVELTSRPPAPESGEGADLYRLP